MNVNEDVPVSECARGGECDFAPVVPLDKLARYEVRCEKCGRRVEIEGSAGTVPGGQA